MEQDNVDDVPTAGKTAKVVDHWETAQVSLARNQNDTGKVSHVPREFRIGEQSGRKFDERKADFSCLKLTQ